MATKYTGPNVLYFMRLKSRVTHKEMRRIWQFYTKAEKTSAPNLPTIWRYAKTLHTAMTVRYGTSPWTMRQIVEVAVGLRDVSSLPPIRQYLPTIVEIEARRQRKERIVAEMNTPWSERKEGADVVGDETLVELVEVENDFE